MIEVRFRKNLLTNYIYDFKNDRTQRTKRKKQWILKFALLLKVAFKFISNKSSIVKKKFRYFKLLLFFLARFWLEKVAKAFDTQGYKNKETSEAIIQNSVWLFWLSFFFEGNPPTFSMF